MQAQQRARCVEGSREAQRPETRLGAGSGGMSSGVAGARTGRNGLSGARDGGEEIAGACRDSRSRRTSVSSRHEILICDLFGTLFIVGSGDGGRIGSGRMSEHVQ